MTPRPANGRQLLGSDGLPINAPPEHPVARDLRAMAAAPIGLAMPEPFARVLATWHTAANRAALTIDGLMLDNARLRQQHDDDTALIREAEERMAALIEPQDDEPPATPSLQ